MNALTFILGIFSSILLIVGIIKLVHFFRRKRDNALLPVNINFVRRDSSYQFPFLYVELEIKNRSGNSLYLSEVQQRNIEGPYTTFLLQDAQGNTKRGLYEIREVFTKKQEIMAGQSLYLYYRLDLQSESISKKLYFQYQVLTTMGIASQSKGIWVIPSQLEDLPFKPKKWNKTF